MILIEKQDGCVKKLNLSLKLSPNDPNAGSNNEFTKYFNDV